MIVTGISLCSTPFTIFNVDMQFKDPSMNTIHNYGIGMREDDIGAYWESLDNTRIRIVRGDDDLSVGTIRIHIWV